MLALGPAAHAACPVDDPTCGVGGGATGRPRPSTVVDSTQATVTATGINCGVAGDDCQESYTYAVDDEIPSVTLTATGVPAGYTARLFKLHDDGHREHVQRQREPVRRRQPAPWRWTPNYRARLDGGR